MAELHRYVGTTSSDDPLRLNLKRQGSEGVPTEAEYLMNVSKASSYLVTPSPCVTLLLDVAFPLANI